MARPKIYIDGQAGTTGLQIYQRLGERGDVELLLIPEERRKDQAARKALLNEADLVFLCLPDDAAREAVSLIENDRTRVIDCSTAHRAKEDWAYGFPELSPLHRESIAQSKRVANPGCHATGFISVVYPLVSMGMLPQDYPLTCFSLTGYSGGGKQMIAEYEGPDKTPGMLSPRLYALSLQHKHLPEMTARCGLRRPPVFIPVVDDYYKGMATTVSLHNDLLSSGKSARCVWEALADYYRDQSLVRVAPFGWEESMIAANTMAGKDTITLIVNGSESQSIVTALFDNLGKGASGAAVQNMNIMLGFPELTGLAL